MLTTDVEYQPAGDRQEVSLAEAARILGVSEQTVRRRLQGGQLEGIKVESNKGNGYRWRVYLPAGTATLAESPPGASGGIVAEPERLAFQLRIATLEGQLAQAREDHAALLAQINVRGISGPPAGDGEGVALLPTASRHSTQQPTTTTPRRRWWQIFGS